jgi:GTPase SAR1 family protein
MNEELRITCIGDGTVGKTSLLWSYVFQKFPNSYIPTVFETHSGKSRL